MSNQEIKSTTVDIEGYAYERVKKSDLTVNIPQEPVFYQEWNHRIIIGLFPKFANWEGGDGGVWEIQIVVISDDAIERAFVRTHTEELSDIVSRFGVSKSGSREDYIKESVVKKLKDYFTDDRVSEKVFNAKYNTFLRNIADVTGDVAIIANA